VPTPDRQRMARRESEKAAGVLLRLIVSVVVVVTCKGERGHGDVDVMAGVRTGRW